MTPTLTPSTARCATRATARTALAGMRTDEKRGHKCPDRSARGSA